ncbi:hypothetical protein [Faecalibaculum rodentium]|uniref:hypothetical protein n=2 Tax=Faecalibaculum rodentium TaxID=1702221 RepID=UPI00272CF6E7|nr:hypothetical protein [Faecalibaculum rodentium]
MNFANELIRSAEENAIESTLAAENLMTNSNIGSLGRNIDLSDNELANQLQMDFPLVDWLMNTTPSANMRGKYDAGNLPMYKDDDNTWKIRLPFTVGTLPPEDTSGECCWTPMELAKCGKETSLHLLCLKDCETMLDNFILKKQRFQANDLINYFMQKGETIKQARVRMAEMSFVWFQKHNIVLGTPDTRTATLKPFNGLLSVIEDPAVIKVAGTTPLAAFDSLACRYAVLGEGDIVYACHPLTYYSLQREIVKGKNGEYPEGWTKDESTGEIKFHNHGFIKDKDIPVDEDAGVGEIWQLDGTAVGCMMFTSFIPSEEFRRHTFSTNNNQVEGCAAECDYYYNAGLVFCTNPNKLAVITDVPLSTNCSGITMLGTDSLMHPDTIVPIDRA